MSIMFYYIYLFYEKNYLFNILFKKTNKFYLI